MSIADIPDDVIPGTPKPNGDAKKEPAVNQLFRLVMKHEASDLHLKVGQPPMMRLAATSAAWKCARSRKKTWNG